VGNAYMLVPINRLAHFQVPIKYISSSSKKKRREEDRKKKNNITTVYNK